MAMETSPIAFVILLYTIEKNKQVFIIANFIFLIFKLFDKPVEVIFKAFYSLY